MKKSLLVIIILAALLAGCGAPGQSPEAIQAQVNTAVAQTLEVEDQIAKSVVLTVDAQVPLSTPTAEVVPTATPITIPTFTPVVPTVTPVAIIPPSGGGSGGGASSPKSKIYSCAIVSEKPYDGASFRPGDSFDKSWTIKNTGSATWEAGWEFEYKGGEDMSPTGDFYIGQQVKPGGTITLVIEVDAPKITQKDSGKVFVMTWSLNNGSHFCTPFVAIKVFTP